MSEDKAIERESPKRINRSDYAQIADKIVQAVKESNYEQFIEEVSRIKSLHVRVSIAQKVDSEDVLTVLTYIDKLVKDEKITQRIERLSSFSYVLTFAESLIETHSAYLNSFDLNVKFKNLCRLANAHTENTEKLIQLEGRLAFINEQLNKDAESKLV